MSIYKFRNWAALATNYVVTAGLTAISITMGGPWTFSIGAAAAAGLFGILYKFRNLSETMLKEHRQSYEYSPLLGDIMNDLSHKAGFKSGEVKLYDFDVDHNKAKDRKEKETFYKVGEIFDKMKRTPNAAAMGFGKPALMISKKLLELLDNEEEKAVLAHEFAHLKAKHSWAKVPTSIVTTFARVSNSMASIASLLSIGVVNALTTLVGSHYGTKIMGRMVDRKGLLTAENHHLTERGEFNKAQMKNQLKTLTTCAVVAGVAVQSPAAGTILVASHSIGIAFKIASGLLSRSNEYQADRVAVELGGNPISLITSLQKLEALKEKSLDKMFHGNVPKRSGLSKMWKTLTSTHPTTENRIKRLADIAIGKGFDKTYVEHIVKSKPDVSRAPDIPYDIIKAALHA